MLYQRISIATQENVGEPGPLPEVFRGSMSDADLAHVGDLVPPELAEEYGDAGFIPYTPPAPTPAPRTISPLGFMQRLSPSNRIAIRAAAKTDPIIEDFLDLLYRATLIQLEHADTLAGVGYMVSQNLITQEEADALLA